MYRPKITMAAMLVICILALFAGWVESQTTSVFFIGTPVPTEVVNARDYGVFTNAGGDDDTPLLQAAVDAAVAQNKDLFLPAGNYNLLTTWVITTAGNSNISTPKATSITGLTVRTTLRWNGSTSGIAIRISNHRNFIIGGFSVQNDVAKGTTTGVLMDSPFASLSTTTHIGTMFHISINGFATGIKAGGGDATSEIRFEHVTFSNCTTGFLGAGGNSLNYVFDMCHGLSNDTWIKSDGQVVTVTGGSATQNDTCFMCDGVGAPFVIMGVRSEESDVFLNNSGGGVCTIIGCAVQHVVDQTGIRVILDTNSMLHVVGSQVQGRIQIAGGGNQHILLESSTFTGSGPYPFDVDVSLYGPEGIAYDVRNCTGPFGGSGGPFVTEYGIIRGNDFYTAPIAAIKHPIFSASPQPPFSTAFNPQSKLSRVQMLAQGSHADGKNLRLQEKFTGSATKAVAFIRQIVVDTSTLDSTLVVDAGVITPADLGKKIVIEGVGSAGSDITTYIQEITDATHIKVGGGTGRTPSIDSTNASADVGENEPDANYMLMSGCSAQETISFSAKATTGFTMTSSNASSTATVDIMVVR